jgi:3-methyladenine DNA glycosylase AlkD
MLINLQKDLQKLKNINKANLLQRFFKTGKGEYGEGDVFLGITVSESRKIALKYQGLSYVHISKLLKSKIHEERLIALLILVHNFEKGGDESRKKIFEFYLKNTKYINNWDLVDLTAPKIVGEYLRKEKNRNVLGKLANSSNLWDRRISIISTYQFIAKDKDEKWTFKIASILISDKHDLIQKAVGWMLREVGKRISEKTERSFLDKNYRKMGRTALRYAIERFDEPTRVKYLQGRI